MVPLSPNYLLASLPATVVGLLTQHLHTVTLGQDTVLAEAGDLMTHVYFPHGGVISLVVSLAGGETIEVAKIGRSGVLGAAAAFEGRNALSRAVVQLPGVASVIEFEYFRRIAEHSAELRNAVIRHGQFVFAQAQQSAACNAAHGVEARLARYLLQMRDLSGNDNLLLTQEVSAQMIGARRNSVSLVSNTLQHAGIIRYSRGNVEILDLDGLRKAACECYATVKAHEQRLLR